MPAASPTLAHWKAMNRPSSLTTGLLAFQAARSLKRVIRSALPEPSNASD
jgi:hypothetical protein